MARDALRRSLLHELYEGHALAGLRLNHEPLLSSFESDKRELKSDQRTKVRFRQQGFESDQQGPSQTKKGSS